MNNFWQNFKDPVFSLAPMEDVTDTVFREIVLGMATPGNLNIVFTVFTRILICGLLNQPAKIQHSRLVTIKK